MAALRTVQARFGESDPELPNGFAEHAPMGAEALLALGVEPEVVVGWADRHEPVALDLAGRVAMRRRSLMAALERRTWEDVAAEEIGRLAAHVGAHLFHGVIRVAHAVRSIRRGVDDIAVGELATALAAWHTWAGEPARPDDSSPALGRLTDVIEAARRGAGACAATLSIRTIHAVTGPMAFLLVADLVDGDAVAAAAAAFGRTHARLPDTVPSLHPAVPPPPDRLTALAAEWDAHPAKLVEAGLRGFHLTGEGVFLGAAEAIMGSWSTTTQPGSLPTSSPRGSG